MIHGGRTWWLPAGKHRRYWHIHLPILTIGWSLPLLPVEGSFFKCRLWDRPCVYTREVLWWPYIRFGRLWATVDPKSVRRARRRAAKAERQREWHH